MKASAESQLKRVESAGAAVIFDLAIVAGLGLVGSFALQLIAPCARRLIVIDDDRVSDTSTILAPYSMRDIGRDKAEVAARFLRRRFEHLSGRNRAVGLNVDIRTLGEGFWRAAARLGKVVLFSCLDNVESVDYATRMARNAGIPSVAMQVGPSGAEVLAFPTDRQEACFACLGLTPGPSRPCLGVRRQEAQPTISTPAAGAASASIGFDLARRLVNGQLGQTCDARLSFRPDTIHFTNAVVRRSATCELHGKPASECEAMAVPFTGLNTWSEIAGAIGDPDAVLYPNEIPPVTTGTPESGVPLAELGVGLWPILHCRANGAPVAMELAGDAGRLGLQRILEARDSHGL